MRALSHPAQRRVTDQEFYKTLVDGSQIASVLFLFLSILFGVKYPLITETLRTVTPDPARPLERKEFRGKQFRCLRDDVLPVAVTSIILGGVLLAPCLQIKQRSALNFSNLNLVYTLFLMVEGCIALATVWCVVVAIRLVLRNRSAV